MAHDHRSIEGFLACVRSRLNRHRLLTTLVWTAVAAAAVLVVTGLWYTTRGYAVPRAAIIGTLAAAALGAVLVWLWRRLTPDGAAQDADRFFHLHDSIISYLHFSRAGRNGGYYALQAEQTHAHIEPLDPRQIRFQPPRRGLLLAACLVAIAVPLGMRGPSERVLSEQQLARDTALATTAINEDLAKLVEELQQEAPTAEEKELLQPNQLREWVKKLEKTGDHKEALRQYAQLERKLNEFRRTLQNKRDEQLLERAARELQLSRETQPLAEQLKQKKYDRSADELQKMRPASDKPLSKQRRELARLKAAAQHMAAAARAARAASERSSNGSASQGGSGAGSGGSGSDGGDLAQMMQDLAEAVDNLDDSLEEALRQESQIGECDAKQLSQYNSCSQCVSTQLSKLTKRLKKLAVCKKCEARLCKLCQACSQCQGSLCCMCNGPNAGGKQAGMGTNAARRNQRDELLDNGQTTALKGIKGHGPSITTVEEANEGSGVSSRRATERARKFERQYESFVAREDIPDEVKEGVKQYFQVIHQLPPEPTPKETPADADHGT